MDSQQQRGRSPSASRNVEDGAIRRSRSPSAQHGFNSQANARGVDPVLLPPDSSFPTDDTVLTRNPDDQQSFDDSNYFRPDLSQHITQGPQGPDLISPPFLASQGDQFKDQYMNTFGPQQSNHQHTTQDTSRANDFLNANQSFEGVDPNLLNSGTSMSSSQLNPSLYVDAAGAHSFQQSQYGGGGFHVDSAYTPGSGLNNPSDTFPSPDSGQQDLSGSTHQSRHQSLDPASAAFPPGHSGDWSTYQAYRSHQRSPSDISDTESQQLSPFFQDSDNFEDLQGNSPLMSGQSDQNLSEVMHLGFSLSDASMHHPHQQQQQQQQHHSIHGSPHVSPNQQIPQFSTADNFGSLAPEPMYTPSETSPSMFSTQGGESFPGMGYGGNNSIGEMGGPGQMSAPSINIDLAPQDKQPPPIQVEQHRERSGSDALSPPARSLSRQRGRARSDPYASAAAVSRSSTSPSRPRAPSLGLHPSSSRALSRSSSPSGPPNGIQKPRDRASSTPSTSNNHNREWMLGLADPNRAQPNSPGDTSPYAASDAGSSQGDQQSNVSAASSSSRRAQKHPANFQCHLCPKRFTRAYNLRSHLRTHTDERPFVCTVCGKAFARQHDRKRHEGLHSGEKKFVCRGFLAGSGQNVEPETGKKAQQMWGCGRRFARADALGRHFRSEAGRTCIKPLLDEEARERKAAAMDQANQEFMNSAGNVGGPGIKSEHAQGMSMQEGMMPSVPPPPPTTAGGQYDTSGMTLPAALLAQYPALAGIQWDGLPAGGNEYNDMEDDFDYEAGGRNSFEMSSGGEWELEEEEGYDAGNGGMIGAPPSGNVGGQAGGNPGMMGGHPQGMNQWNGANGAMQHMNMQQS
ncbi:MAG: DNA-binding transcription factor [Alyxoria varia]|nr:MAG: DNA-binding transcription factor [Alyxoria varia]